jgi:hypothetical protein
MAMNQINNLTPSLKKSEIWEIKVKFDLEIDHVTLERFHQGSQT